MIELPTSLKDTIQHEKALESALQGKDGVSEKRVPPGATEAFISSPTRTAIYRQIRRLEVKASHGQEPTPDDLIALHSQLQDYWGLKSDQEPTPQSVYNQRLLLYLPTNLFLPPLDDVSIWNSSYLPHEAWRRWYVDMRDFSLQYLQQTLVYGQPDTKSKVQAVLPALLQSGRITQDDLKRFPEFAKEAVHHVESLPQPIQTDLETSGMHLPRGIYKNKDSETLGKQLGQLREVVEELRQDERFKDLLPVVLLNGSANKGYWQEGSDFDIELITAREFKRLKPHEDNDPDAYRTYMNAVKNALLEKLEERKVKIDPSRFTVLGVPPEFLEDDTSVLRYAFQQSEGSGDASERQWQSLMAVQALPSFLAAEKIYDPTDTHLTQQLLRLNSGARAVLATFPPHRQLIVLEEMEKAAITNIAEKGIGRFFPGSKKGELDPRYRTIASLAFVSRVGY